jgi:hypothetical protein
MAEPAPLSSLRPGFHRRCRRLTCPVARGFGRCTPNVESHDDAMGRMPVPGPVYCRSPGDLQPASADFGHFRVRGAWLVHWGSWPHRRSSQMRGCLTSALVAQLRLANLVQGDWLSGASQVAHQGGVDHLMRAGPFDDLPGTAGRGPVRGSGVPEPRRSRHPRHREILASSTTQPGSSGSRDMGGDPASEPESAR